MFLIALAACGGGGGGGGGGSVSTNSNSNPPLSSDIQHKEVQTGGVDESTEVTTSAPLSAGTGELYLAAVSSRPPREVLSIEGLGLSWFLVGEQCSARGVTGLSVWRAMGDPKSASTVTASFDSQPTSAVISVSRYAGIDAQEPLGDPVSANTLGKAGTCFGGTDTSSYTFELDTSEQGSLVYATAAMRNRMHDPLSEGYSERAEVSHGSGGGAASLAVQDAAYDTPRRTSISGEFSGEVDWAVLAVELKPAGSSVPRPDVRVEPALHDFGTVLTGTGKPQAFKVYNDGIADLNVSGTSLGGIDAGEFVIDAGDAPFTVPPGFSHDVTVSLFPGKVGVPNAYLRIQSDDPDESPLDVTITGKAVDTVESDIVVDPADYDYGFVTIGAGSSKTISVLNDGLADLNVESTSFSGANQSLFSIELGGAPFTVAPGATQNIAVRFDPVVEDTASATLEIASDDMDEPQVGVSLSGTGAMIEKGIWISAEELASLPMAGEAWEDVKDTADKELEFQPISKLASDHDTQTLAVALVYARMGGDFYRQKVVNEIKAAMGTEVDSAQAVGPCRNIVPYVISADLIDLENFDPAFDTTFRNWIDEMRFVVWPDGSMIAEDEERANNHGRMCGAARATIAVYLNDQDELDRAATVFAGLLGDQSVYDGFLWKHDLSWQAEPTNPVGVNPVGAVRDGLSIDGALPEEMRRGGEFQIPPVQTGYPWEALQGMLVEAVILERAGYYDVFEWSDQAILRIVRFVERLDKQFPEDGWWATGDDRWVPWVINHVYGTDFPHEEASHGKLMAWTDWTHAP